MAKPPTEVLKKYYIIKKVRGHGDDHHGGAWKIALADFYTTLAMVFFVLWVAGTVPEDKLAGVSEFFKQDVKQTYNAIKLDANGKVLSEKNTQDDVSGSKEDAKDNEDIKEDKPNKETIIAVYNQLSKELDKNVAEVILAKNKESIEIKFVADLLFKSASDDLSPKSIKSIDKVGLILNGKGLYAHVYGFADNRKMRPNQKFRDNLNLSSARAMAVVNHINTIKHDNIFITMHADGALNPIADNNTRAGRKENRRVEVYITLNSSPPREFWKRIKK
ncbi:OmpA/MotB family protein [Photobacterium kishitanii]|uniref:OmpA/MotB family protein n=1 Tax=Photobacterium kishitanii TaxID=318456 RepID=UPI0007F885BE|nr:OmpA family protein [Photobacterium kishitanii]OBU32725.1 hypothetical protein AYY23_17250 [Photobacterium kishitanii]PSW47033.1 hypothetical protein C0W66_20550 [Photobacterium kishitanii]